MPLVWLIPLVLQERLIIACKQASFLVNTYRAGPSHFGALGKTRFCPPPLNLGFVAPGARNKIDPPYFSVYIFLPKRWHIENFRGGKGQKKKKKKKKRPITNLFVLGYAKLLILYFLRLARFCAPTCWRPRWSPSSPNGRAALNT